MPECLLDEFSRLFLQDFNTGELLQSARCKALLIAMGIFVRFEITRIECRHAHLLRFVVCNATWKICVTELSARYLLLRSKLVQSILRPRTSKVAKPRTANTRPGGTNVKRKGKQQGKPTGGGGAQRAFVSEYLTGKKYKTREQRSAVLREAEAERKRVFSGDAFRAASYLRRGAAGTASYRAGGFAFGPRKKRKLAETIPRASPQVRDLVHLGASLSNARATLRDLGGLPSDVLREKVRRCEDHLNNVSSASQSRIFEGGSSHLWPPDLGLGVHDVRQAPDLEDMTFTVNPILPPVLEIGKRMLEQLNKNAACNIQKALLEEWDNAHCLKKHSEVSVIPSLGPGKQPLSKVTLGRRVGYCMCSGAMKSRALFREALVRQLGKALVKWSAVRKVYEGGSAVLRLYSPTLNSQPTFWFLGMGNLNDLDFTVQRLHEFDEPRHLFVPSGTQVFKATDDRPVDIEVVGSDLVFGLGYTYAIEILKLDVHNKTLVSVDVCPLACVVPMQPQVLIAVWPVVKARRDAAAAPPPRERRRNPVHSQTLDFGIMCPHI